MGSGYNHWSTRWRVGITLEEYAALDGLLFYVEYYNSSVTNGSSVTLGISTPTTCTARGRIIVESDEGVTVQFYEDSTYSGGSAINAINMDRTSSNVDSLTFVTNPTVTNEHFKIKSNAKYIIKVTNVSGDASKIKVGWFFMEQPA